MSGYLLFVTFLCLVGQQPREMHCLVNCVTEIAINDEVD